MKLFTLGPVEMFPSTLDVASKQIPYFRTPEFSEVVLENERLLKKLTFAEEGAKVVFLTASGTAAMEATVMNCFTEADKLLVIDGGSFGHRFVELCGHHEIPHAVLPVPFGKALTADMLEPFAGQGFTGLLVNIHETSTGQLYDITMLSKFCRANDLYFVVDAISAFLADEISMTGHHIDVLLTGSQKALALAPGLALVVLSERMYEDRIHGQKSKTIYLDFDSHIENGKRGQTPFTPAVGIILELNDMLRSIDGIGYDAKLTAIRTVAEDFRAKLAGLGLELPSYTLSNATTPLIFPDGNALDVYNTLKNDYDVVLTPNGGELGKTLLRVGHLGNHTVEDNDFLIDLLHKVL